MRNGLSSRASARPALGAAPAKRNRPDEAAVASGARLAAHGRSWPPPATSARIPRRARSGLSGQAGSPTLGRLHVVHRAARKRARLEGAELSRVSQLCSFTVNYGTHSARRVSPLSLFRPFRFFARSLARKLLVVVVAAVREFARPAVNKIHQQLFGSNQQAALLRLRRPLRFSRLSSAKNCQKEDQDDSRARCRVTVMRREEKRGEERRSAETRRAGMRTNFRRLLCEQKRRQPIRLDGHERRQPAKLIRFRAASRRLAWPAESDTRPARCGMCGQSGGYWSSRADWTDTRAAASRAECRLLRSGRRPMIYAPGLRAD